MPNHFVYGATDVCGTYSGFQVGSVLESNKELLNLDTEKPFEIYVNGEIAPPDRVLNDNDRVECLKPVGRKGGDVWTKQEWLNIFGRNEKDWQWCVTQGMPTEPLSNRWIVVTEAEAIRWNRKVERHRTGGLKHVGEHSVVVSADIGTLNDMEENILEAIGEGIMTGEKVAVVAGYKCGQGFRTCLSVLVRRGLLENRRTKGELAGGYFRPGLFVDG